MLIRLDLTLHPVPCILNHLQSPDIGTATRFIPWLLNRPTFALPRLYLQQVVSPLSVANRLVPAVTDVVSLISILHILPYNAEFVIFVCHSIFAMFRSAGHLRRDEKSYVRRWVRLQIYFHQTSVKQGTANRRRLICICVSLKFTGLFADTFLCPSFWHVCFFSSFG